jgi:hypothetical protein
MESIKPSVTALLDAQKTGVYTVVHEDLSTLPTKLSDEKTIFRGAHQAVVSCSTV